VVRAATLRNVDARGAKSELLEAEALVEQRPSSSGGAPWRVRLATRRGTSTGEREIEAATCAGLAEATAVVLALALVPQEPEPDTSAPASDRATPAATSAPRPPNHDRVVPRKSVSVKERRAHALALGASVVGDASTLPSPAIGGSATLAWTPGRFRLEADARRWGSQSGSLAGAHAGARFTMTSLGGRACFAAAKTDDFDFSPCAGADANLISALGFGAETNYSPDAAWAAMTGGALGRITLGPWLAIRTRVEAIVPLSRPTFVVENEGNVHRPATFGVAASLGIEALFL
jgi:hypothetical protein